MTFLADREDATCVVCHKPNTKTTKFVEPFFDNSYYVCVDPCLKQVQLDFEFRIFQKFGIGPRPGP